MKFPGNGCCIQDGRIVINAEKAEEDKQREPDEVTMELLLEVGNSIHKSIQLTTDFPTKNRDKKLPILDLKVWTKKNEHQMIMILYEHYRKDVATVSTIHARSATAMRQKKTIMTQELLRIMKNCSRRLDENVRNGHINEYMKRMQYSGHTKTTRYDVYLSAKKAYEHQVRNDQTGEEPLYRPKTWRKTERKKEKREKKHNWYKANGTESVIFVPCTPDERLKKAFEEQIRVSPFNIKVIEKSGRKLKDVLHKKNPFKASKCERPDCFICTTDGRGDCMKENVTYKIECTEGCELKDIYQGESSYNGYTRGSEHLHKYNNNDPNSMLIQHCNVSHRGEKVRFKMDVTGSYHNDATKRQITEGLEIERTPTNRLMNSKTEWNTPSMPSCVVTRLSER